MEIRSKLSCAAAFKDDFVTSIFWVPGYLCVRVVWSPVINLFFFPFKEFPVGHDQMILLMLEMRHCIR